MLIKLKTLKGEAFDTEVTPDMLIGKVKELAVASEHGTKSGWEVEGVKLIFQGKVLDNDKDLASYNINEGDFMVVMAAKPKKPAAAAPAAPAEAAAPATPAAAAPAPAAPAPAAAAPAAPAPAAPAAAQQQFSPAAQAAIDNLVEMGYQRDQVQAAMVAAFMNPDRAVQYLEEGIPQVGDDGDDDMEDEPTPSTWQELAASASFRAELAAVRDQEGLQAFLQGLAASNPTKLQLIQANPQAFAALLNSQQQAAANQAANPAANPGAALPFGMAAPPGGGGGGGGGGLPPALQQMMAQNPQMLEGMLQNPEMLAQLLQLPEIQQAMQSPELMEQLGVDPMMLQQVLGSMAAGGMGGGGGGGGVNPVLAQLNEEDEQAIQRLMALGFPRPIVIQAYLACEKNENLAANFLFDQGGDLM